MIQPVPEQVTRHVWRYQSRIYDYNSGIIESHGSAWLIDPGIAPEEVLLLKDWCHSLGWQVEGILVTHFHYDHILGVNAFEEAAIIAHAQFPQEIERMKQVSLEKINGMIESGEITLPDWSLDVIPDWLIHRRQAFLVGDLLLEVIPLPGHTADQIGIHIPEDRLLWAADTLSDLEIPFTSHSAKSFEQTLKKLAGMDVELIVPGHGNPSRSREESIHRIQSDWQYLKEIRKIVRNGIHHGKGLSAILTDCDGVAHPNLDANRSAHQWNVESVFIEEGGISDAGKIGWEREWQ